jgi:hypothetical protein
VTVFDQNQHAVILLGAVLLGWQAGCRKRPALALLSGLLGGLLLNYQEMYALMLPAIGLCTIASEIAARTESDQPQAVNSRQASKLWPLSLNRAAYLRLALFAAGSSIGLGLFFGFNWLRFGSLFSLARYSMATAPTLGSPLAGLLGLTISPGKGALWFSPPLVLAILGGRRLFARAPALAATIAAVSIIHLLVIIHLAFFGGDWCWGPRYLIPLMPLWALALPFGVLSRDKVQRLVMPLAAAGLLVQLLGISLDQHRFFYERDIPPSFWATDAWFYFRESQLIARFGELASTARAGVPREVVRFTCSPNKQSTYCLFGPRLPSHSHWWMRQFQVFYLPRPWWGWMSRVPPGSRPIDPLALATVASSLAIAGVLMLSLSLRRAARVATPADQPEIRLGEVTMAARGYSGPSQDSGVLSS